MSIDQKALKSALQNAIEAVVKKMHATGDAAYSLADDDLNRAVSDLATLLENATSNG